MKLFNSPENIVINAIKSMQTQVQLNHCCVPFESILRSSISREPKLIVFLSGYRYQYISSYMGLFKDYTVSFEYNVTNTVNSLDDVVLDDGTWDASCIFDTNFLNDIHIVTDTPDDTIKKVNEISSRFSVYYEGCMGYQYNSENFENISKMYHLTIQPRYMAEISVIRGYQGRTLVETKKIWKKILGNAKVPKFVMPFLAFSYITQECCYDQRAFDEVEKNSYSIPSDFVPHIAYGPLVQKRGICGGLSWAFKYLMDAVNIECICVSGYLKENKNVGHAWNIVKIDSLYYHVDPSSGITQSGVWVNSLMQPDSTMKSTHEWVYDNYPQAKGMRFDYDYIEDFLAKNGVGYLNDGADEKYFFPDEIYD